MHFLLIIEKKGETALNHRSHCGHELSIFYCNKNGPSAEKLKFSSRGAFRKKNLPLCCLGSSENIALSRPIKISVWYRFPAVANRSTKHRHSSDNRIHPPLGKRTRQRQQLPVARSWLLSNNKGYCFEICVVPFDVAVDWQFCEISSTLRKSKAPFFCRSRKEQQTKF